MRSLLVLFTATALTACAKGGASTGPPPPAGPCGAVAPGVCYYVDGTTGNDGSAGDSTHPFQTIQHAAGIVNPGDVVIVRNGVYTGSASAVLDIGRGGTPTAWVTFKAEHQWGAALDGGGSPGVQGVSDAGVHFSASYVRVEGFEIRWAWHDGVDMGSDNIALAGNNIHDVGRYCENGSLGISAIAAYANNLVIEQNLIHDIGRLGPGEYGCAPSNTYWQNHDHGIYLSNGNNVLIRNNVFHHLAHGWPVHRYGSTCDQLQIVNNTFAFPNPNKVGHVLLASDLTNSLIANNIFYQPTTAGIDWGGVMTNVTVSHNLAFNATVTTTPPPGVTLAGNVDNTDPLFVNAPGADFHLRAASPAINAGLNLSSVPNDFDGVTRPQGAGWDIGAFEFH
jgi:hypothetical protein